MIKVSPTVSVRVTVDAGRTAVVVIIRKLPGEFTQEGVVMVAVAASFPITQPLTNIGAEPTGTEKLTPVTLFPFTVTD